jgi:hypothetical protein
MLGGFVPRDWLLQGILLVYTKEAKVDENFDKLWETGITKSTSDNRLSLWNIVSGTKSDMKEAFRFVIIPFAVSCAIPVAICDKIVSNEASVIWLCCVHKVRGFHVNLLTILKVFGLVL